MDLRFGTWNVRSMYRAGSLRTVAEEVSKYTFDLVGVQRSDGMEVAPNQQASIHFSMGRGIRIIK
jgi:hypothetical protein